MSKLMSTTAATMATLMARDRVRRCLSSGGELMLAAAPGGSSYFADGPLVVRERSDIVLCERFFTDDFAMLVQVALSGFRSVPGDTGCAAGVAEGELLTAFVATVSLS